MVNQKWADWCKECREYDETNAEDPKDCKECDGRWDCPPTNWYPNLERRKAMTRKEFSAVLDNFFENQKRRKA